MAILSDRNCVQKEAEKKLKYKSLCTEIQWMWNLKCKIIPEIIGATGIVTKGVEKNLEALPGKHSRLTAKTAVLGILHIIRKVLQSETWSVRGGNQCWAQDKYQEEMPATRDRNMIIIIIPRVGSGVDTRGEGRFPYDSVHLPWQTASNNEWDIEKLSGFAAACLLPGRTRPYAGHRWQEGGETSSCLTTSNSPIWTLGCVGPGKGCRTIRYS